MAAEASTASPRVLVLSERKLETPKWQAPQYEFEDVILEVEDAALVAPSPLPTGRGAALAQRVLRRTGHEDRVTEPRMRRGAITGEYDLFFAVLHFPHDAAHLHRLRGWRERCRHAVCFIVELWTHEIEGARPYLELLGELGFDRIFLFNPNPRELVEEVSGRPAEFMGVGVDGFRFSPYPNPPARTIDFYQFGRRSPVTHEAALAMAREHGAFYLYDTVFNAPLPDPAAHRELMASILKRSRYFFSYRTADDLERSHGENLLGPRFFEGVAGGAVVLGSAPDVPEYEQCFGWPDSTISIPYEAANLREIVAELETQPERLARARTNNVANTLRSNDWVYRWAQVLDAVGLPRTARMHARTQRLEELAQMAEADGTR